LLCESNSTTFLLRGKGKTLVNVFWFCLGADSNTILFKKKTNSKIIHSLVFNLFYYLSIVRPILNNNNNTFFLNLDETTTKKSIYMYAFLD
jgi:hypothetical protein